jgi:hypothetical protein
MGAEPEISMGNGKIGMRPRIPRLLGARYHRRTGSISSRITGYRKVSILELFTGKQVFRIDRDHNPAKI